MKQPNKRAKRPRIIKKVMPAKAGHVLSYSLKLPKPKPEPKNFYEVEK